MTNRLRTILITGSGMFGVWDRRYFAGIVDYNTWSKELLQDADIKRHVAAGHFVPITNYSDGAFDFEVRVGNSSELTDLNDREREYVTESSEPIIFRSAGELNISGIEFVAGVPDKKVGTLELEAGEYMVTVHQIAWEDEPGAIDEDGNPSAESLPNFLILVNPSASNG